MSSLEISQPIACAVATRRAPHPMLILAVCCLSLFLVTMDVTIVNIALPSIRSDLRASMTGLQWSVDAYAIVVASFLMLRGRQRTDSAAAGSSRSGWRYSASVRFYAALPPRP